MMGPILVLASLALASAAAAQGSLSAEDGGYFCALELGGSRSAASEDCKLTFYPGNPVAYFARFEDQHVDIVGNPFRDKALTIGGKPAKREKVEPFCFAFEDGSGSFCIGR